MHTIRFMVLCCALSVSLTVDAANAHANELVEDLTIRSLFADLLHLAGYGHRDGERAAFLVRDPGGEYRCVLWPSRAYRRAQFTGSVPAGTVAIVHTHPNGSPKGSIGDQLTSRTARLPIFVLSLDAVYVVTPEGKNIAALKEKQWAATARGSQRCGD